MTTKTRNEAAEHARQDWRVEQEPAYLLRVDKADGRLDSLSRSEFNSILDEALAAERHIVEAECDERITAVRRATVERILADWPDGRDEPFKDADSDMAVGYRNGWLAGRMRLRAILDEEATR